MKERCKVVSRPPAVAKVNSGDKFVLVNPDDYIPIECVEAEIAEYNKRIKKLEAQIESMKKVDAEENGELYWPLLLLPEELSLLSKGQLISMRVSGIIGDGKVLIQEVRL